MARSTFTKAVDVTPEMAATVIAAMRTRWGEGNVDVKWCVRLL